MIDIHCHILPNVDDGAADMEASLQMARQAVSQGIEVIIATPHHANGSYLNEKQAIIERVDELNERLSLEQIPLVIYPGQETRVHGEMVEALSRGEMLPLNYSSYVFVELPSNHVPRYTNKLVFDLQVNGYTPIIVHPERNKEIIDNPDLLYQLVKSGALTQVTAASVIGKFGKKIEKLTNQLIEANLTHFLASDAHNTTTRAFCLDAAYQYVEKNYGMDMVYYFDDNSRILVAGETVVGDVPEPVKRKKFLGLF
ncbi:tyrosine-protein phosphatase [Aquibacillus salsiterrae]|uniref:Tyrosine-protein phosphatase n=1 Tax=Aquibacillus salsiterrae TaxID=2950439 RepID=A0A9X3WDB2_9BACI|nr:CpsB/CapC family capsule biosynthesis tyrosine phosphatase [Aquibacillus salsiterrae]MDC3416613.1 tyrosine protein phosphatase [Aquibacillus salsiterrae]